MPKGVVALDYAPRQVGVFSAVRCLVTGGQIAGRRRTRLAVVYARRSTRQQVVDRQESTRPQYALAGRAVALDWAAERVMVIDDNLGMTGAEASARAGFQRLVTEIGLDHVGLTLGIEMSRLSQPGND